MVGEVGGAADAVERQLEIALALQCAETVGAADRVFEFTIEYAQDRFAFGRPIASFQALKHRIADMLHVARILEGDRPTARRRRSTAGMPTPPRLASVAKAYVGDRCLDVIDDCVQINGGIGVTWEHDIHLYSRRAAVEPRRVRLARAAQGARCCPRCSSECRDEERSGVGSESGTTER